MIPVFPTVYFGHLNYYRALTLQKKVLIEAKEHFIKQTYRNRCEILTANGVQALSIPVYRRNGSKTSIDEVEISCDIDWRKDHWKAIESAYSSSPYFEHYGLEIKELIFQNETNLLKFNETIQDRIFAWFDFDLSTDFSTEYSIQKKDYRTILNQNTTLESTSKNKYIQVFSPSHNFVDNLSILDALFCLGPMARKLIVE